MDKRNAGAYRPFPSSLQTQRARRKPARTAFWAVVMVGIAGLGSFATAHTYMAPSPNSPAPEAVVTAQSTPTQASGLALLPTLEAPLTVLFMATDVNWMVRDGKRVQGLTGNTDTMMLVRFDPARGDARILSIPRDTRTAIAGHGTFKINAANPYGGPKLARQTVENLLATPIDRHVLVNTAAVMQLVDALGGLTVTVPRTMRYRDRAGGLDINLKAGPHKLDGHQAHDFLRFRHDDMGDIGRVQRQQIFLQAAVRQLLTPRNLLKIPELVHIAHANLETDLSMAEMTRLGVWGRDLTGDRVRMTMLPGREAIVAGGWYWLPDEAKLPAVVSGFLLGDPPPEARNPRRLRVAIRDGIGDRHAVTRLTAALGEAGYARVDNEGRDAVQDRTTTLVIAQNADETAAQELAAAIGVGEVQVAATGVIGSDVTVVVGRDWLERIAP